MVNEKFDIDAFRAQPLPTEDEIIANWQGDFEKPVVSILCHMFNQERYIEDAFRGFLIQKTNFVFEVIAHDDASTDGTSDIVREYANRYPKIFKPVIQTENQYSKGAKPCLLSSPHAKGKYFALCEGDDFWINENKLQQQYLGLLKHTGVKLCFTAALRLHQDSSVVEISNHSSKNKVLTASDVVRGGGSFIPTASLFMEREVISNIPTWFIGAPVGDYYIQVWGSNNGALYISGKTCIYRVQAEGSWSSTRRVKSKEQLETEIFAHITTIKQIDMSEGDRAYMLAIEYSNIAYTFLINKYKKEFLYYIKKSWSTQPNVNKMQSRFYFFRYAPSILFTLQKIKSIYKLL